MSDFTSATSAKAEKGVMPEARYVGEADGVTNPALSGWIGMRALASDGETRVFAFWRNARGDLRDPEARHQAATLIARLKMGHNVEAAIGLPIDVNGSDPTTQAVSTIEGEGIYGVYIDIDQRPGFSFRIDLHGLGDERDYAVGFQPALDYERTLEGALDVLPVVA